ncbi:MAG: hypothetical protein ABWY81_11065 [Jiangellaceae bacterium]
MAFPADPLPIVQEMYIDGELVDVTSRTRNSDSVIITRGYSSEQANFSAASAEFTLNNRDGLFSNKNPNSIYYGLLGRNVRYRTGIAQGVNTLRMYDKPDPVLSDGSGGDGACVVTADKAVLDIVGDIDIRIDVEPDDWRGRAGQIFASKWLSAGGQASWVFGTDAYGYLFLRWTTDGFNGPFVKSTSPVTTNGRQAVRVTLDVNNGAGGYTAAFYTATSLGGSYTALGSSTVTSAGVTSIFSSTTRLEIGDYNTALGRNGISTAGGWPVEADPFCGKIYGFELRSGLGGTVVAQMLPATRAAGDRTWSDGLGTPNTWSVVASAEISGTDFRFFGEIPALPNKWDSTGTDVYIPVRSADITQRLRQGEKPLRSAIYRALDGTAFEGWWPLENGTANSPVQAVYGANATLNDASFTSADDFPGANGVLQFTADTGTAGGRVTNNASITGTSYYMFSFKLPAVPVAARNFMHFYPTGGTVADIAIGANATQYTITFYDAFGVSVATNSVAFGAGAEPNKWITMRLKVTQSANFDWELDWYPVGRAVAYGMFNSFASVDGRPDSWSANAFVGKSGMLLSHVVMDTQDYDFIGFAAPAAAYVGEAAIPRFYRLCLEQGIPAYVIGLRTVDSEVNSVLMGPQSSTTLFALLQECVDADGGYLFTPRDKYGLSFRTLYSIQNRARVSFDYSAAHLSGELEPTPDDTLIRNDVTVSRPNGGQRRAIRKNGSLNVQDPADDPNGVGTYDTALERNVATDDLLWSQATWERFLGTWDELRYTRVEVELARQVFVASATLTAQVRGLDLFDPIKLTNLPAWLPPDDVDLLIIGSVETLRNRGHEFRWNTRPYGPYLSNDLTLSSDSRQRASAVNSRIASDITSSTLTPIAVTTTTGKLWGMTGPKPGNFPLDVVFGGERITVSAIGAWMSDDFGRTNASSWGSTSTGNFPWVTAGGVATDYNVVAPGFARMNLSTVTTVRTASLDLDARISELRFARLQQPTALTGAGGTGNYEIRIGRTSDYIALKFQTVTAGTAACWMSQVVGGVETTFDAAFPSTGMAATNGMSVFIEIIGLVARAKVWPSSSNEPSAWTTTIAMTQQNVVGDILLTASRNALSTNAAPFNIEWDGLTVPRIQAMTASARSVNGIVKAHSADTVVDVAEPFYATRD